MEIIIFSLGKADSKKCQVSLGVRKKNKAGDEGRKHREQVNFLFSEGQLGRLMSRGLIKVKQQLVWRWQ